jgi:hypothetical protein
MLVSSFGGVGGAGGSNPNSSFKEETRPITSSQHLSGEEARSLSDKGASSLQQVEELNRFSLHALRHAFKISPAMIQFMGSPGLNPSAGITPTLVKAAIAASADKFSPKHNFSANLIAYSPWVIEDAETH